MHARQGITTTTRESKRFFHINALKKWHSPVPAVLYAEECSDNVEPLILYTWNDSDHKVTVSNLTPDQLQDLTNQRRSSEMLSVMFQAGLL